MKLRTVVHLLSVVVELSSAIWWWSVGEPWMELISVGV